MYSGDEAAEAVVLQDQRLMPREQQLRLSLDVVYQRRRGCIPRRPGRVAVDVIDLSLEGALLRTPADLRLGVGSRIVLVDGPGSTSAQVRRVVPTPEVSSWRFYGVQFDSPTPSFEQMLSDRLGMERCKLHDLCKAR